MVTPLLQPSGTAQCQSQAQEAWSLPWRSSESSRKEITAGPPTMDVSLSKPPFSCFLSDNLSGSVELSKSPHLADGKCQAFKHSLETA